MPKSTKKVVSIAHQPYKWIKLGRISKSRPRKKASPSKSGSLSPPAIVNPSTKSIENGKRDVEKNVEKQVVICKKQKTFDDTCDDMVAVFKSKFDTKTLNKEEDVEYASVAGAREPAKKNVESSGDDSNSVEERDSDDDESESGNSSDEEDSKNGSVAGASAAAKKNVESSDDNSSAVEESDSDDESEAEVSSDEEKDAKNGSVAAALVTAKKNVESSDADSNSVEERDSEPQTPATPGSSYVYMGNLSRGITEEDVFDTSETAQKALKRNWELLYDYPVEIFLVHDEMSNLDLDPRSKSYEYLFMDNLSPSTRIKDVLDFFKDTGKVVLVRFDRSWGRFSGSGYVQFSTPEEARKGLKRNKEKLNGCAVELLLTTHAVASVGFTNYWRKVGRVGRGYGPTISGRDVDDANS